MAGAVPVQDACLLGTPSGTGDTTPPYGWMCLGRYGGSSDPCSVPIAKIERDEVFAGQNALEEKVKGTGPLRGLLTILDWTINTDNPSHANYMREVAFDMRIPEENLRVLADGLSFIFSNSHDDPTIREKTVVYAFPNGWAFGGIWRSEIELLRQHNFLTVASAGNTDTWDGRRDLWYPEHPHWKEEPEKWERAFAGLATGKVLLAKYALPPTGNGPVRPHLSNVRCGLAKEYCYSIIAPALQNHGTSGAAVNLGALTFYLFQLWDTPREVVGVLNACAEDVGEPGIDEEFGRGIVSVVCDTVQNRERSLVSQSLSVYNSASPAITEVSGSDWSASLVPQSLALPQAGKFRPFYALRGYSLETVTGHLGGELSLKGANLFVLGGTSYTPLGIRSSLLPVSRTPFMELGTKRTLFSRSGHTVSLLTAYGYSEGPGFFAHTGHVDARYERRFGSAAIALQTGLRHLQGAVGIPGYREAGAGRVPFTERNLGLQVSFTMGG